MDDILFLGEHETKIDKHNRIKLPIFFREILPEKFYLTMGLLTQCIWVMPEKVFRNMLQKVRSSVENCDVPGQIWISHITSNTLPGQLDKYGRITIPSNLKDYAAIKETVKLLGHDDRLEIWGAEKWNDITMGHYEFTDFSEQVMKKYGINLQENHHSDSTDDSL